MKKIALLCFAVLGFISTNAQLEWAPVGAKYYYAFCDESLGCDVEIAEVTGDTIIAGKNCKRFSNTFVLGAYCYGMEFTYEEDGRVYFYNYEAQDFSMLYDFNKGPGESWVMPICSTLCGEPDSIVVLVDSISITEINGVQVRTQHVSWEYPWDWGTPFRTGSIIYEGIGNFHIMYFASRHPCGALINSFVVSFNCYESPTHGIFNFRGEVPCNQFSPTPTEGPTLLTPQLKLSPNPVSDELELRFTPQLSGRVQVRVFDARGRVVVDVQKELAGASLPMQATDWPAGLYILHCMKNGKVLGAKKFVKQ
ncbi:MAG: T9SS type A sorting domain-containing protein [Saprospiraceae bacterium]|nr:T9SS type A sorting domain-containing protein [Saprospiraceae bacterium]